MQPMKMRPAFKDYLWGGTRLREEYGKDCDLSPVAESWEISCHPDGPSTVMGGPCAGKTLAELLQEHPEWMGTRDGAAVYGEFPRGEFPLLIKLIDAAQSLSIQVHPADDYARRVENQQGKNEMWYVVDAAPGAELIIGFQRPVDKEELRRRIADGTLEEVAAKIPVRAGDCFSIPAGMLHAIGGGILIAEVQQNSNVTYRVYDFGRKNPDGSQRELHVSNKLRRRLRPKNISAARPRDAETLRREVYPLSQVFIVLDVSAAFGGCDVFYRLHPYQRVDQAINLTSHQPVRECSRFKCRDAYLAEYIYSVDVERIHRGEIKFPVASRYPSSRWDCNCHWSHRRQREPNRCLGMFGRQTCYTQK